MSQESEVTQLLTFLFCSRYDIYFSEISIRVFWSTIAGILFIGAVIGATIMPTVANKIGSRCSFILIGIVSFIFDFFKTMKNFLKDFLKFQHKAVTVLKY